VVLAGFESSFVAAGLPLVQRSDLLPVQWAKLLLNLNNSINALSGLPLKEQLSQRDYRRCVSLAQQEALALLERAGIRPARLTPLPTGWIPTLLSSPDWLFARLANRMLAIDPHSPDRLILAPNPSEGALENMDMPTGMFSFTLSP